MRTRADRTKHLLAIITGIVISFIGMNGTIAIAQITPGSRICAARDVEVITLIEDHGNANDIASERLAAAGQTWMHARIACSAGRVEEGVALYDEIVRSLGPMLSRRTQ